jgi:hypothetical protein
MTYFYHSIHYYKYTFILYKVYTDDPCEIGPLVFKPQLS